MNNDSYEIKYFVRCDATDEETKIVQLSILAQGSVTHDFSRHAMSVTAHSLQKAATKCTQRHRDKQSKQPHGKPRFKRGPVRSEDLGMESEYKNCLAEPFRPKCMESDIPLPSAASQVPMQLLNGREKKTGACIKSSSPTSDS